MIKILLLHTNTSFATSLAAAVETVAPEFDVTVHSREPVSDRLLELLLGDYDLIQTDEMMINGVLATCASIVRRIPHVVCLRGWADYTNTHGQYGLFKMMSIRLRSSFVTRGSAGCVPISNTTKEAVDRVLSLPNPRVIGRPIEVNQYEDGTDLWPNTLNLTTVTNLRYAEKYRGVALILEALGPLFDKFDDLRYRVAGGGEYLAKLEADVEASDYSDRVELLGFRDDIENVLASSDVFVYSSYLDAYPTVVLEAQAAGLPIIATDTSGVPEVVGDYGIVTDSTPEALRSAVDRVLHDGSVRNELADQSRQRMETHNEEIARQFVKYWESFL